MNNGTNESAQTVSRSLAGVSDDELSRAKRQLLQAEIRFAKARATIAAAEIDIKVAGARLKALAK
jgi:hypothetical protein